MMMFLGGIFVLDNIFSPGRDFEKFKNQVVVINPEMHFGQTTNGSFISTIGQIRNGSPYSWKDIQLEVQYFDKDGRMIDTHTENRYGDVTPPGDVQAFRIRSLADKPEAAYVSEKIFVRAAKDSSKWP